MERDVEACGEKNKWLRWRHLSFTLSNSTGYSAVCFKSVLGLITKAREPPYDQWNGVWGQADESGVIKMTSRRRQFYILYKNWYILIHTSLNFVPRGPINNKSAFGFRYQLGADVEESGIRNQKSFTSSKQHGHNIDNNIGISTWMF